MEPALPPTDDRPGLERSSSETPSGSPDPGRHDSGAFSLTTLSGIPIRVHFSFLLLLAWLVLADRISGRPFQRILFILALFGCVILHELGHAVVARRYGIHTRDIVLYPIGGIASFETSPRPRQELWIALAGPAVNLVIAAVIYGALRLSHLPTGHIGLGVAQPRFSASMLWANVLLAGFNLIPAFPMDGGRILRALIARGTDEVTATGIAARIGQLLAVLFGIYGFLNNDFLSIIIAVFVYTGAGQEAAAFQTRVLAGGRRVREAMLREFRTLPVGATLRQAADALLAGSQQDFPIVNGDEVMGVLPRAALMRGIASEGPDTYVAGVMTRDFQHVHPEDDLLTINAKIDTNSPILVMEERPNSGSVPSLVGMLTQENLIEFLTLTRLQMEPRTAE